MFSLSCLLFMGMENQSNQPNPWQIIIIVGLIFALSVETLHEVPSSYYLAHPQHKEVSLFVTGSQG